MVYHRYCSSDHGCEKGALQLKEKAEPIFHEYKVDLVLQGHVHSYERSYPVYQDQVTTRMTDTLYSMNLLIMLHTTYHILHISNHTIPYNN